MDTLIIGAGLACARRLHAAGRSFMIYEAADRVGGRVATDVCEGYRPEFYLGLNFPRDVFFEIPEYYARHNAWAAVPGRIVVFHDNQDRRGTIINQSRRTLAALPVFFSELEKQGFKASSLAHVECSGMNLALLRNFSP